MDFRCTLGSVLAGSDYNCFFSEFSSLCLPEEYCLKIVRLELQFLMLSFVYLPPGRACIYLTLWLQLSRFMASFLIFPLQFSSSLSTYTCSSSFSLFPNPSSSSSSSSSSHPHGINQSVSMNVPGHYKSLCH